MTKSEIDKLSKELYDAVVKEYLANPGASFQAILQKHLKQYNAEIAKGIQDGVVALMNEVTGVAVAVEYLPATSVQLSKSLYNGAEYVAKQAQKAINEHLATKGTIDELRKKLYEGYGLRPIDEEILDIKPKLPKYLQKDLTEAQLAKLKTKDLKAAYLGVMDAKNDKELAKALNVAIEEKARYYALRIAQTEEAKAYNIANTFKMYEDGVKYVKWTRSGRQSIACVCDYYERRDVGYGPGVSKLEDAVMPVYSTHPHCLCVLRPYKPRREYNTPKPMSQKQKDQMEYAMRHGWEPVTVDDIFK